MPQNDYYKRSECRTDADADEIRKAYRKLARKHHPDLNPGDKAAEDRFKKVQEAYDILSEPKKKQMYDQYGFYSDNGCRRADLAGQGGPQRGPNMGFGGFDFSDFTRTAGSGSARGRSPGAGGAGGPGESANFQDIFSQWFGGAKQPEPRTSSSGKGRRPRIRTQHRFLAGDQGHAGAAQYQSRQETCTTCNGTGGARSGGERGLSGMQRQRQRHADGRRDEVQSRPVRAATATGA